MARNYGIVNRVAGNERRRAPGSESGDQRYGSSRRRSGLDGIRLVSAKLVLVLMAMIARRGIGFVLVVLLELASMPPGWSHDRAGRYAEMSPETHAWFNALASGRGLCCSFADGMSIEDVDWDTSADDKGVAHYRVRLDGHWIEVPDAAVVNEPNKLGRAIAWPYQDAHGKTQIRCFLPGAGA